MGKNEGRLMFVYSGNLGGRTKKRMDITINA